MGSIKNANPYKLDTVEQRNIVYSQYFSLNTNTAASYTEKLKLINCICFLQQRMNKKDPKKYDSCLSLLKIIFNKKDLTTIEDGEDNFIVSLAILCDDLLWGINDEVPKPEGFNTTKEIKEFIVKYVIDEWMPF